MFAPHSGLALLCTLLSLGCGDEPAPVHRLTPEMCTRAGGQIASAECPSGTEALPTDVGDARHCCADLPIAREQCLLLGGTIRASNGSSRPACLADELTLAGLWDFNEGALCCAPEVSTGTR
jgi:hypothetical protein